MNDPQAIQTHYTYEGLWERVENAIEHSALTQSTFSWEALAPLDQFHVRGLFATKEIIEALSLRAGEKLLDLGSGLGGPARCAAATHGVHVVGIDLSPQLVEVATRLTALTGMSEWAEFLQGDVTELDLEPASFDHAMTQHVSMNIQDKSSFYKSVHRVLKPGGRFAIHDIFQGNGEPIFFPVPWAGDASSSFLVTIEEAERLLVLAGFRVVDARDRSEEAKQWFVELRGLLQDPDARPPLNLIDALGGEAQLASANIAKNLMSGRVRVGQIVAERP